MHEVFAQARLTWLPGSEAGKGARIPERRRTAARRRVACARPYGRRGDRASSPRERRLLWARSSWRAGLAAHPGWQVLSQACDAMVEEYDVSCQVLEQDVLALARDLVDKKLVSVA